MNIPVGPKVREAANLKKKYEDSKLRVEETAAAAATAAEEASAAEVSAAAQPLL